MTKKNIITKVIKTVAECMGLNEDTNYFMWTTLLQSESQIESETLVDAILLAAGVENDVENVHVGPYEKFYAAAITAKEFYHEPAE